MSERARIEGGIAALRTQRDFFLAIDMDVAADHCEESAISWEGSLLDLERAEACGCYDGDEAVE